MKLKKVKDVFNRHPIIYSILLYAAYTLCFFLTERINTREAYLIHSSMDDLIPFSRYAVIPYCLWFPEISIVLLYVHFRKDEDEFFRAVFLPLMLMFCSLPLYYLFPTEINLRPAAIVGNDVLSLCLPVLSTASTTAGTSVPRSMSGSAISWLIYGKEIPAERPASV